MKKESKFLFLFVFGKEKFEIVIIVEGVEVVWIGILEVGIELRVVIEEGEIFVLEGMYLIEMEEVIMMLIVDGNGIVIVIEEMLVEEVLVEEVFEVVFLEVVVEVIEEL